jgi:hypothetical protein
MQVTFTAAEIIAPTFAIHGSYLRSSADIFKSARRVNDPSLVLSRERRALIAYALYPALLLAWQQHSRLNSIK